MATQDDIRMDWIHHEYTGMREAMFKLMKRMDAYESAVLGLTEAVSQNSQRLDAVEQRLDAVEQRLTSLEAAVLENRSILLSIADHLDLTLQRPPQYPQSD
ncbi:MAG: hypothetical protein OXG84_15220 [Chloroflexi bacterium]|nr:hypothetical protein [Chloroflexota bacterium]